MEFVITIEYKYSQLSINWSNVGEEVMDNPKSRLKQH
jgi:hypothetical protein